MDIREEGFIPWQVQTLLTLSTDRAEYHMRRFHISMIEEGSVTTLYSYKTNKKYFTLMCIKPVDIMH